MKECIYINDIKCCYKEYRFIEGKWRKTEDSSHYVNSNFIKNMLESKDYFIGLGGTMNTYSVSNRRFGLVPSKIVCVSICGAIKKVFSFNYSQAQVI